MNTSQGFLFAAYKNLGTSRRAAIIAAAVVMAFLASGMLVGKRVAHADTVATDFESGYATGTIDGQNGWTATGSAGHGCATYDEGVVANASSAPASFGAQSFRISNAVASGCFSDQAFAAPLADGVGEATSSAGTFPAGTRQNHFEAQFDIVSASPAAQQPGLRISVSPDRGDGARMSYLRFEDGTAGIDVFFDDAQGTSNPANFVETQVASGLDRTVPHTIKLTLDALEGPSNDIVKVYIDGSLVHVGTSWENYSRYDSEAASDPHPAVVRTLIFRAGGAAAPATAGNGFLFDNISLSSSNVSEPATIVVDQSYASSTFGTAETVGGATYYYGINAFSTINDAVKAANSGNAIRIAAGTYAEQLTITKSLVLSGSGSATTIIKAPGTLASDANGYKSIVTVSGASTTAEISGLTISGPGPTGCGSINAGIFVRDGAYANIHDDAISAIADNVPSGCQNGIAIVVGRSAFSTNGTATIANDVISGYQKNGIVISNASSSAIITDSTVTGAGPTSTIAQNGIQVSSGATATLTGNTVSGNAYFSTGKNGANAPEALCTGTGAGLSASDTATFANDCVDAVGVLLIQQGAGTTMTGNAITGNQFNVYLSGPATAVMSGNTIASSSLYNIAYDGAASFDAARNYWGATDAASIAALFGISAPSTTITFTPWCMNALCAQAAPAIAWAAPADIAQGIALGADQLDATSSVPGTFAYAPVSGTILSAGSGQTLSVSFTPNDTLNYRAVSATTSINVIAPPSVAVAVGSGGGGGGGSFGGGSSGAAASPSSSSPSAAGGSNGAPATASAAPSSGAGQVLGATAFNFTGNLGAGMSGDPVAQLQKRLSDEGFYRGPITGYFGQLTLAAVKDYQAHYDIPDTGVVGSMTRTQLNDSEVAGASINVVAVQAEIASLQAQVQALMQQLQAMTK